MTNRIILINIILYLSLFKGDSYLFDKQGSSLNKLEASKFIISFYYISSSKFY